MDTITYAKATVAVLVNLFPATPAPSDITNPNVQFYNPGNGHIYEFINSSSDWEASKLEASSLKIKEQVGYLATIMSASEQAFIESHLSATPALAYWIGGKQNAQGTWKWETGPEAGTAFWQGQANGSVIRGNYNNWDLQNVVYPQPNCACEPFLGISTTTAFYSVNPTYWFDGNAVPLPKIVEYGGLVQILPNTNGIGTFTTSGVINVIGSKFADTLVGNDADNTIDSGDGADIVTGNGGLDRMAGGKGPDIFAYKNVSDSPVGLQRDVITDFGNGKDRIDLSAIDANVNQPADQAFQFIDNRPFSGIAGQLRFSNRILSGDVNGDKMPDFEIYVSGKVDKKSLIL